MTRLYNFCAGPAALPTAVLTQAQTDLLNWQQKGLSIMEMSHRSPEFVGIAQKAEQDLRDLMVIPDNYKVLFMQGGASSQFTMIPIIFSSRRRHTSVVSDWSSDVCWCDLGERYRV